MEEREKTLERIDALKKEESVKILWFLAAITITTLFVLFALIALIGKTRAWQLYFFIGLMLAIWLALRLLELESGIEGLEERLGKNI